MSLTGKVALITGASSGIGAATARLLAARGALLALTGRSGANLERVAAQCTENGVSAPRPPSLQSPSARSPLTIVADIVQDGDCKRVVEQTVHQYGCIDVLVNCAGVLETGSIETTSMDQYDRIMNVNSRAVYHLIMLTVPYLVRTGGNIVNVSSVNGIRSFPNVLAYNVSKAAVDAMTRSVALDVAAKGVRVNSVNPGVIVTELQKRGGLDEEAYAKFLEHSKSTHALGRVGQAEEVAAAIAFLASEEASFITGVSLPVDGGRHAMCPR